ncbi:hypothetical protein A3734_06525 [Sulfitobacter sp. HI0054]|uniref:helix-turn-helix domain-containing protein n=1 Tax=Sulfitobacter sp. HI0054 TaxID=1822238 RepID=UPI0007C25234|nr:helix-turn-helix domain-containing protein [Sulfitobacter sp. HI0054]KZY51011.1 hypothetical protein A3734_06525 [Sulfitobacter sp. HI0054]
MTQTDQILSALKAGRHIMPMDALSLCGCFRLSGRIYDLRQAGHKINRAMVETDTGARVASYSLEAQAGDDVGNSDVIEVRV